MSVFKCFVGKNNFCSELCTEKRRSDLSSGENNPNYKNAARRISCVNCKKEFSTYSKKDRKYCSISCFNIGSFSDGAPRYAKGSKWGMSGSRAGFRDDIGIYVRSSWEANYARFLQKCLKLGIIGGWDYEPIRFVFDEVSTSRKSYRPDFYVKKIDGSGFYVAVKGYMSAASAEALDSMRRCYPDIGLVVLDSKAYMEMKKTYPEIFSE